MASVYLSEWLLGREKSDTWPRLLYPGKDLQHQEVTSTPEDFWLGGVDDELTADVYFDLSQCFWMKIFQFQANLKWTNEKPRFIFFSASVQALCSGLFCGRNALYWASIRQETIWLVCFCGQQTGICCRAPFITAELIEFILQCECICRKGW